MSFDPGRSNEPIQYETIGRRFKDGVYVVPNRFEISKTSILRFLNPVDPEGNEYPIYTAKSTIPAECLGMAFCRVTVANVFLKQKRKIFNGYITTLPVNKEGKSHRAFNSPAEAVLKKLNFELDCGWHEQLRGLKPHVPEAWMYAFKTKETFTVRPYERLLVQVIHFQQNNQPLLDAAGNPAAYVGVLELPSNMAEKLYENLQSPTSKPGGSTDIFSIAGGHQAVVSVMANLTGKTRSGEPKKTYIISAGDSYPLNKTSTMSHWRTWTDILDLQYPEDQIQELIEMLGADIVDYGLRWHPIWREYIPKEIKDISLAIPYASVKNPRDAGKEETGDTSQQVAPVQTTHVQMPSQPQQRPPAPVTNVTPTPPPAPVLPPSIKPLMPFTPPIIQAPQQERKAPEVVLPTGNTPPSTTQTTVVELCGAPAAVPTPLVNVLDQMKQ